MFEWPNGRSLIPSEQLFNNIMWRRSYISMIIIMLSALYLTNKLSYISALSKLSTDIYVVPIGHICFWFWTNYSLRVYMSFKSGTFVSDSEPTTLCGYICRSNRTHLFLILNQLLFADIYVVQIGHICFRFWTNYYLRVYMSFQSDTFVSDSEPTTLCGYICHSNRKHLFLILNQLLFASIYVVPMGHICFWLWTNYSLRYICRSNRTHLFLIMNQLLFAGICVVPIGHICFWFWTNYSALAPYCCLSPVKQHITLLWLFLTRPRLNPAIYRYHVHHYTTYNVSETCNRCNDDKNLTVFLV